MFLKWFGKKKTKTNKIGVVKTLSEERHDLVSILRNLLSKSQDIVDDECAKLTLSMLTSNLAYGIFDGTKKKQKSKFERFTPEEVEELPIQYKKYLSGKTVSKLIKLDSEEAFDAKKFATKIKSAKKGKFGILSNT